MDAGNELTSSFESGYLSILHNGDSAVSKCDGQSKAKNTSPVLEVLVLAPTIRLAADSKIFSKKHKIKKDSKNCPCVRHDNGRLVILMLSWGKKAFAFEASSSNDSALEEASAASRYRRCRGGVAARRNGGQRSASGSPIPSTPSVKTQAFAGSSAGRETAVGVGLAQRVLDEEGLAAFCGGVSGTMLGQRLSKASSSGPTGGKTLVVDLLVRLTWGSMRRRYRRSGCSSQPVSGAVGSFVVTPVERVKCVMQASSGEQ